MDQAWVETVRVVRGHLRRLVDEETARRLDPRLAALLDRAAAGEDVSGEMARALTVSPALQRWAAQVHADPLHRHPALQSPLHRTTNGPAGHGEAVGAERYSCPVGHPHVVWWRLSVGEPVPECATHQRPLARD